MESVPLLGRPDATTSSSSPKANKYRYKRRPMAKFLGKLRNAMSSFRFVFQSTTTNTSWEDSPVEIHATNKKGPSSGRRRGRSMSYLDETATSRDDIPFLQEESYGPQPQGGTIKKLDMRSFETDEDRPRRCCIRDALRSNNEDERTFDISDEESHSVKRVRFMEEVVEHTIPVPDLTSNIHMSEAAAFLGPVSVMRLTFSFLTGWHSPIRHGIISLKATTRALKDGVKSFDFMLPPTGDRSGAFPTADGAFPTFIPNSHELN